MIKYIYALFGYHMSDGKGQPLKAPKEKSTLEIIRDIIKLMEPMKPLDTYKGYETTAYPFSGHVNIYIREDADLSKINDMKFTTLTTSYEFYGSKSVRVALWEYEEKISSNYRQDYMVTEVLPVYSFLCKTNEDYSFILNRFNLSMLTAYDTIRESRKNNDGLETEEVFELVKEILDAFLLMVRERRSEIDELKIKLRKGTNQSHKTLLEQELEYVNKFIKGERQSNERG